MKEWAVWMANKMEEQLLRMEQLRLSEFVAYEKNWQMLRVLMQKMQHWPTWPEWRTVPCVML